MATRSTRSQPFCWQEKKILRLLKKQYQKSELVKFKCLYLVLTEIDSDFNGQPIKFYTKTIAKYSGLSDKWIPQALQALRELEIVKLIETRDEKKRVTGRELIFTPEKVVEKPDSRKPNIRKPDSRRMLTLEDSSSLEDSIPLEEKTPQPQNGCLNYTEKFLEFYFLYPKHANKMAAFKKWKSLKVEQNGLYETIITSIKNQAPILSQKEKRYIKAPDVWLNKGCWEDELEAIREKSKWTLGCK